MKVIICVDEKMGLTFQGKRVSKDRIVRDDIRKYCNQEKLIMNAYSHKMFMEDKDEYPYIVSEELLKKENGYHFVENMQIDEVYDDIDELVIYNWNRRYPCNRYLDIDLSEFDCVSVKEFSGSSHDLITRSIYIRRK